ncbi:MAG: aminoglycoside phosphotransferase family protein [Actinomycetota bacterium]
MADEVTVAHVAEVAVALVGRPEGGWTVVRDSGTSIVLRGNDVVVKRTHRGQAAFEAEIFGLRAVEECAPGLAPALVGADDPSRVVVMTDLGDGPSVADLLLADCPDEAAAALVAHGRALASLHNASWAPSTVPLRKPNWLRERHSDAEAALASVGIPSPVLEAFRALGDRLLWGTGPRVLSPGDVCPDNNVIVDGDVRLFDFEGCGHMHPAMDLAYLALPNPTCWCSFDIPEETKTAAIAAYIDEVKDPVGVDDLHLALALLATTSIGLTLGQDGLDEPWTSERGVLMPSPAQRLIHRVRVAADRSALRVEHPELATWLDAQLTGFIGRWPHAEILPVAPAFR